MRNFLLLLSLLLSFTGLQAQFPTYWHQRASLFEQLPVDSASIVFLGNSITDGGEWGELFNDLNVKNRGISGDVTEGVLQRLPAITSGRPAKIFLMIGVNDLARNRPIDSIAMGVDAIVKAIGLQSPSTQVFVESVLPVNDIYGKFSGHTVRYADIAPLNALLKEVAANDGATFIDLYSMMVDPETSKMRPELSNDGLHLLGPAYLLWRDALIPFIRTEELKNFRTEEL